MEELQSIIIQCLSPDLLKKEFRNQKHPLAGHCYVASEAYYHLSSENLTPQYLYHENQPHWYLKRADGKIIDLTAEQFQTRPDYSLGRSLGFLTKQPSKRAKILIGRVMENRLNLFGVRIDGDNSSFRSP